MLFCLPDMLSTQEGWRNAMTAWYDDEMPRYSYASPSFGDGVGHFTQARITNLVPGDTDRHVILSYESCSWLAKAVLWQCWRLLPPVQAARTASAASENIAQRSTVSHPINVTLSTRRLFGRHSKKWAALTSTAARAPAGSLQGGSFPQILDRRQTIV